MKRVDIQESWDPRPAPDKPPPDLLYPLLAHGHSVFLPQSRIVWPAPGQTFDERAANVAREVCLGYWDHLFWTPNEVNYTDVTIRLYSITPGHLEHTRPITQADLIAGVGVGPTGSAKAGPRFRVWGKGGASYYWERDEPLSWAYAAACDPLPDLFSLPLQILLHIQAALKEARWTLENDAALFPDTPSLIEYVAVALGGGCGGVSSRMDHGGSREAVDGLIHDLQSAVDTELEVRQAVFERK